MIKIHIKHNQLFIQGHENGVENNSLICCAVSAITNTAINCFKKNQIKFISKKGYLKVKLISLTYKTRVMWQMMINQLYVLYLQFKKVILWIKETNYEN